MQVAVEKKDQRVETFTCDACEVTEYGLLLRLRVGSLVAFFPHGSFSAVRETTPKAPISVSGTITHDSVYQPTIRNGGA